MTPAICSLPSFGWIIVAFLLGAGVSGYLAIIAMASTMAPSKRDLDKTFED